MKKCLVLQSGYITPEVPGLALPVERKPDITDAIIKPYRHVNTEYYYAPALAKLYDKYTADDRIAQDFDFREQLIREAIRLFDGVSFKDWIFRQIESPMLNDTNAQFLLDTLNYIVGNQRTIDVMNWIGLVESQSGFVDREYLKDILECYFGLKKNPMIYTGQLVPMDLTSVLSMWMSRPSGFRDFFVTVGIIFGDHRRPDIIASVPTEHETVTHMSASIDRKF